MLNFRNPRGLFALSLLLGIVLSGVLQAEDWPQWRGRNCSGIAESSKKLPVQFSSTENVKWKADIGDGICAPCVVAGRVFVTSMSLPDQDKSRKLTDGEKHKKMTQFNVFCFDATTGQKLWHRHFSAGDKPLPTIHETNSYASATPAADAERVYVYFTREGMLALDVKDGHTVWQQKKIPEPFFVFDWGPGMSPVLHEDKLLFCQDDDLSPALYCLDKKSGEILWRDSRTDFAVSYSHPIICQTPEGPEAVVAGTGKLVGYDLSNGKRKWAAEVFCRNIKTTPLTQNGIIYLSVESLGISYQWRATADKNGDGKITRAEIIASRKDKEDGIPEVFWKKFERGDKNKDGVLEGDEIDEAFLDPSNKGGLLAGEVQKRGGEKERDWNKFDADLQFDAVIQAVRGGGHGDVSKTHTVWKHVTKGADHLVSPLVAEGRMFLVKGKGLLSAYEIEKGKPLYVRKRFNNASTYLGAPVFGDGKIYVPAENGKIVVLSSSGEFQEALAVNDMEESCINAPAIADGRLYIRTRNHLYCIAGK